MTSLAALAVLVPLAWTWRHPTAFPPLPDGVSVSNDRWVVGEPLFVGMTYPFTHGEEAVTLHGAEVGPMSNTADATVSFGICTLKPGGAAIGSVGAQGVAELCARWAPVDGYRLTSETGPRAQLLMKVTPRRSGTVEIAGTRLTYSQEWRTGTQDVGEHLLLNAG
ncbi:MAG: hypothetical protein ACXVW4_01305 [Nocardioides sp.]